METTKIKVTVLQEKIEKNRKKHKEEFDSAMKVWVKKATKALKKAAKQAEETGEINEWPLQNLPKPVNFLKSYDSVIARLDLEVEETVEVEEREFQQWVLDDWQWRGQFRASTQSYNSIP